MVRSFVISPTHFDVLCPHRDYCIRKDSSSTGGTDGTGGGTSSSTDLKKKGDNGNPSSAYPLGMCEGDVSISLIPS